MKETIFENIIEQKFLENCLSRKIDRFVVTNGTNPGDNYCSTMYSIEVQFTREENASKMNNSLVNRNSAEKMHLISKCYPTNAIRQEFLIKANAFHKELSFYTVFVPELLKLQKDLHLKEIIQPAFPTVVSGYAINFDEEHHEAGKVYKPFDNYIMMIDLRKTYGFRLSDKLVSFDRAHVSLIMDAMARNHALSWAYKQKHNISDITTKYPFIKNDFSDKYLKNILIDVMSKNGALNCDIIERKLGKSSPVATGARKFVEASAEMLSISYGIGRTHAEYQKVMRLKPRSTGRNNNDIPWKVVIQGDCWSNNMLFRYNDLTGEPKDVILVDLQLLREACPTADVAYMIYTSTDAEFRKQHLEEMLEIYAEKFLYYCKQLKTEPLPGFGVQELKRRFHFSKGFAFCLVMLAISTMLAEDVSSEDLEAGEGQSLSDVFAALNANRKSDDESVMMRRVVEVAQDMYDDGII